MLYFIILSKLLQNHKKNVFLFIFGLLIDIAVVNYVYTYK